MVTEVRYPVRDLLSMGSLMIELEAKSKVDVVEILAMAREAISSLPSFPETRISRETFVAVLTIQGAAQFDDMTEFAELCVEFCRKKERELIISG